MAKINGNDAPEAITKIQLLTKITPVNRLYLYFSNIPAVGTIGTGNAEVEVDGVKKSLNYSGTEWDWGNSSTVTFKLISGKGSYAIVSGEAAQPSYTPFISKTAITFKRNDLGNIILDRGEPLFDSTTNHLIIGDGDGSANDKTHTFMPMRGKNNEYDISYGVDAVDTGEGLNVTSDRIQLKSNSASILVDSNDIDISARSVEFNLTGTTEHQEETFSVNATNAKIALMSDSSEFTITIGNDDNTSIKLASKDIADESKATIELNGNVSADTISPRSNTASIGTSTDPFNAVNATDMYATNIGSSDDKVSTVYADTVNAGDSSITKDSITFNTGVNPLIFKSPIQLQCSGSTGNCPEITSIENGGLSLKVSDNNFSTVVLGNTNATISVGNDMLSDGFISLWAKNINADVNNQLNFDATALFPSANGSVALGTPSYKFRNIYSTNFNDAIITATMFNGVTISDGNIDIDIDKTITAGTFNATSDARLKENFQPLTPEKSILDLPTYKFNFIGSSDTQIGCKAQDLQEICPEIVNEGADGYLSIQESKIVYLLLEEVKKLRKEIDELRELTNRV